MESLMLAERREKPGWISLDPRTKLWILVTGNIAVLLAPSLPYEIVLVGFILIFGLLCGVKGYTIKMTGIYLLLMGMQILSARYLSGSTQIFIVTFAVFLRKVFPCAMLGGILISTTRVNEFMAAMYKLALPKSVVIPLAVTLRYFPMLREEWVHIRDAMKMRGVSPSLGGFLKQPVKTTECIYVPMMISASKIADELSAAAVTRGIDNPRPRTCLQQIGFGRNDLFCTLWFTVLLLAAFWM